MDVLGLEFTFPVFKKLFKQSNFSILRLYSYTARYYVIRLVLPIRKIFSFSLPPEILLYTPAVVTTHKVWNILLLKMGYSAVSRVKTA